MQKNRLEWGLGTFHKCEKCGEKFYLEASQTACYVYKKKQKLYCSYTCYRKK